MEGVDQFDLLFIDRGKTGVQVHDAPEDGDRHTGDDDRRRSGAQPYDQKRRQRGFRQAVQHYQIGLQYLGEPPAAPEQDGGQDAAESHEQEAYDRLIQRDADVQEDRAVQHHFPEAQCDPRRAAEDKGVDHAVISAYFPQKQKKDQDKDPGGAYDHTVAAQSVEEEFLPVRPFFQWFDHRGSAPSIFR